MNLRTLRTGGFVYLKKPSISHCNFEGCNNHRIHFEGTLVFTDLFHEVHPLLLRAMIQQDRHLKHKAKPIVKTSYAQ